MSEPFPSAAPPIVQTLLRHILGMLKAQSGSVKVFGLDPVENPVGVLGRIGDCRCLMAVQHTVSCAVADPRPGSVFRRGMVGSSSATERY